MDVLLSFTKINRSIITNNKQQTAVQEQIKKHLELPHRETIISTNTLQTKPFDNQKTENMSNNKKQTGVEYLVEQLFPKALSVEQHYHIEKAKEMDKERTINDYIEGRNSVINREIIPAEQYYNETYGGDKQ